MKPWHVEIFGGPIELGAYATVIATPDQKVRFTVWSDLVAGGRIAIGPYALICPGVRISAARSIEIGSSCMLAQGVLLTDADWHDLYDRSAPVGESAPLKIGNNVWIGDSAILCKGVQIGDNAVIGAGAVVRWDIPANVIAVGNPANVIKTLDPTRDIKTREDWLSDPERLAAQFDEIDRILLKNNSWTGWLRSHFFPHRGD